MKFETNYWKRFEFPSFEKLNTVIDALNFHIKHDKTAEDDYAETDPAGDYEHWASVIKFSDFDDIQSLLDSVLSGAYDTKISTIIVAPISRRPVVAADYYISDPSTQLPGIVNSMSPGSSLFFLAGNYIFSANFSFSVPVVFIGEVAGGTNFIFDDSCAITYGGHADSDAPPAIFKNILFMGSYEKFINGMGMKFEHCVFYYKGSGHIIGTPCEDSVDHSRPLIETTDGDYPAYIKILNCRFVLEGPGVMCNVSDDMTYEHLCAVRHKYKTFIMIDSVIDQYGPPTLYFYRGIVIEDDGTPEECKISGSRIITYGDPIRMQQGGLLIDNCEIGRTN